MAVTHLHLVIIIVIIIIIIIIICFRVFTGSTFLDKLRVSVIEVL